MLDRIRAMGALAPVIFIILYIVAAVLFVPGSVLTIGAGVLFGLLWGSIYVSIGATLGATAAFLVGRYLARDWVRRQLEGNRTSPPSTTRSAREGWKIVLLTRLSPVFPFNLLNYAFGLTAVTLARLCACVLGRDACPPACCSCTSARSAATSRRRGNRISRPRGGCCASSGSARPLGVAVYASRIASRALNENAELGTRALIENLWGTLWENLAMGHEAPKLAPLDAHNLRLLAGVHPEGWKNPSPGAALQHGGDWRGNRGPRHGGRRRRPRRESGADRARPDGRRLPQLRMRPLQGADRSARAVAASARDAKRFGSSCPTASASIFRR